MKPKKVQTQLNKQPRVKRDQPPKCPVIVKGLEVIVPQPEGRTFILSNVQSLEIFDLLLIEDEWSFGATFYRGMLFNPVLGLQMPEFDVSWLKDYRVMNAMLEVIRKKQPK